jgi:hypothetical protein
MMEKFDGVRVYWTGKELIANNSKVPIPKDMNFPAIPFDGELW